MENGHPGTDNRQALTASEQSFDNPVGVPIVKLSESSARYNEVVGNIDQRSFFRMALDL